MKSINKCHQCGATSYKPVIKRDELGAMTMSGTYQCTGCRLEFTTIDEWRTGTVDQVVADGVEPRPVSGVLASYRTARLAGPGANSTAKKEYHFS